MRIRFEDQLQHQFEHRWDGWDPIPLMQTTVNMMRPNVSFGSVSTVLLHRQAPLDIFLVFVLNQYKMSSSSMPGAHSLLDWSRSLGDRLQPDIIPECIATMPAGLPSLFYDRLLMSLNDEQIASFP